MAGWRFSQGSRLTESGCSVKKEPRSENMTTPWKSSFSSLPKAPNVDIADIRGNIPDAEKHSQPYLRVFIVEINVRNVDSPTAAAAEIVFEIEVTESMCNVFGTMHGGCAAFMVDCCTYASTVLHGVLKGFDGTGVSQFMSITWHHPAPLGTTLSIMANPHSPTDVPARHGMRDKQSGKLVVSGSHSILNPGKAAKL
ncbi:hypothetical protein B0H10DRAFT_1954885 [Mycena sp. CBHHK59/15]|nr:hypothetical protein B0H10DRAFT_1954885 [Mycena sp. CBHHK59/15]